MNRGVPPRSQKDRRHCEEIAANLRKNQRHCEEGEARRGNLFEIIVKSRDWLTGDVVSPALRAYYVRPKSLPAILSLRSQ